MVQVCRSVPRTARPGKPRGRRRPYTGRRTLVNGRTDGPLVAREEQQLIDGLLAGNEDAVRTVYARFAGPVFTLGLRILGSAEAAEELTQDVFLTAWRKAARFDATRGRLSTWLMTIAHNLAVDRLRRETGVTRPHLVLVEEAGGEGLGEAVCGHRGPRRRVGRQAHVA